MTAAQEQALTPLMDELLEALYQKGYRRFFCGGALGFDLFAAMRVGVLSQRHSDVRLLLAIPCAHQTRKWPMEALERYTQMLCQADESRVLSPHYYRGCMLVRNRYMVDRSSLCVCYLITQKGGTAFTVSYALEKDLPVLNVANPDVVSLAHHLCSVTPNE